MTSQYTQLEHAISTHTGSNVTSDNLTTFLDETSFRFEDMFPVHLFACMWFGHEANYTCSESWFTEVYILGYGKCFSFNYEANRDFYQVEGGSGNGLFLMIDINDMEYTGIAFIYTFTIMVRKSVDIPNEGNYSVGQPKFFRGVTGSAEQLLFHSYFIFMQLSTKIIPNNRLATAQEKPVYATDY